MSYRIIGTTSEGESFDFPGVYFESHDDAVTYAMEYARCVSGTDTVDVERVATGTAVIARGPEYAERLWIGFTANDRDLFGAVKG